MSKHTDGPWVVENGGRLVATAAEGANGWELCDVRDDVYGYQHNARLIAAAPDLLEALDEAVREYEKLPHSLGYEFTHLPKMRALIARVRGES